MSVEVKIPLRGQIDLSDFLRRCEEKSYRFGVRGEDDEILFGKIGTTTVVFDTEKIGRGVEMTLGENDVELRLTVPCATSDKELFLNLLNMLIEMVDTDEIVCEGEAVDISRLAAAREQACANMRLALEFVWEHAPVEIFGVFGKITVDEEMCKKHKCKQSVFDEFLHNKQVDKIGEAKSLFDQK